MQPDHHGPLPAISGLRPDIEIEAVLTLGAVVPGKQPRLFIVLPSGTRSLRRNIAVIKARPHIRPRRRFLRGHEAVCSRGVGSVRDILEGDNPIELYARTRGAGFGVEVKRRIILGTYVLSSGYYDAYYLRAQKVRTLIRNDFLKAFATVDAIVTPTSPTAAFKIGEKSDDPLQMYLSDIFTISCNLAGICGVSLPCGFTRGPKLPVGLQLLGQPFGEATMLRLAHAYEQSTSWHKEKAPL